MAFEDNLKRRLRRLGEELERGNEPLVPARPGGRRGVKLRHGAAGIGMAACIAASLVLFSQILPDRADERAAAPSTPRTGASDSAPAAAPVVPEGERFCKQELGMEIIPPPEGITVTVVPAQRTLRRGETIGVEVEWRNDRSEPVTNDESGHHRGQIFVAFDAEGNVAWNSTEDDIAYEDFTADLVQRTRQPGESDRVTERWNGHGCSQPNVGRGRGERKRLPPGEYLLRARWGGAYGGWSEPVPVVLV